MSNLKSPFGDYGQVYSDVFAIERMIVNTQAAIHEAMVGSEISQKELAERLNCTPARVSQYLSEGGRNMNLKTLAKIARALDLEFDLRSAKQAQNARPVKRPTKWHWDMEANTPEVADGANDNRVVSLYGRLAA